MALKLIMCNVQYLRRNIYVVFVQVKQVSSIWLLEKSFHGTSHPHTYMKPTAYSSPSFFTIAGCSLGFYTSLFIHFHQIRFA
jgi:hypothetical protein